MPTDNNTNVAKTSNYPLSKQKTPSLYRSSHREFQVKAQGSESGVA